MNQGEPENSSENASPPSTGTARRIAGLILRALLICNVLVLFNIIAVSYFIREPALVVNMVSWIALLEGGVGLVFGGFMVIGAGPSVSKIGEKLFHGSPYSPRRARDAEANARVIFFFSLFLIIIGYLLPLVLA